MHLTQKMKKKALNYAEVNDFYVTHYKICFASCKINFKVYHLHKMGNPENLAHLASQTFPYPILGFANVSFKSE